eukprot:scaffold10856_cov105-Skeletonema_menzelii.AAC.1
MTKFPELSNDLTDDMVFPTIAVSRSLRNTKEMCTRLVHREVHGGTKFQGIPNKLAMEEPCHHPTKYPPATGKSPP